MPTARPIVTAAGRIRAREILLLSLNLDGFVGHGEVGPLPGFHVGTLERCARTLDCQAASLLGLELDEVFARSRDLAAEPALAPLAAALDGAAWDAAGRATGRSVASLLSDQVRSCVSVNATIGDASTDSAVVRAIEALDAGYGCVKLKVGIAASMQAEVSRIIAVSEAIGGRAKLRLDANGAWSVGTAIALLEKLEKVAIEFVEQPVAAEEIAGLAEVRRASRHRIAADEAARDAASVRRLIDADAIDAIVVKPTFVGGLTISLEVIELARAAGVAAWVTTAFDLGVGTAAALHLAATLPLDAPHCGLATSDVLESDLLHDSVLVEQGMMHLPTSDGLGVDMDPVLVDRYAVGPSRHLTHTLRSPGS